MVRTNSFTMLSILLVTVSHSWAQIIIDKDTVFKKACAPTPCGEQLIVTDGVASATTLDFIEPALLDLESPPRIPGHLPGLPYIWPAIAVDGSSTVNISGGRIRTFVGGPAIFADGRSSLNISGGFIKGDGGIVAVDQTFVHISGGEVRNSADFLPALLLTDGVEGEISGGELYGDEDDAIHIDGDAQLRVSGGLFNGIIRTEGHSLLDIRGGVFQIGFGGVGQLFTAGEDSTVNILGGSIPDGREIEPEFVEIDVRDNATVNVFGNQLVFSEDPLVGMRLTGFLADGSPINVGVRGNVVLHESFLRPGDANQDLSFDREDIFEVLRSGKYLTGQRATWGEGDWDGAPGGAPGAPPDGDGLFDQRDILAALQSGLYLTGPYAAVHSDGQQADGQTSILYNMTTGEFAVDSPLGVDLTSINIDSAAGIFTGDAAANLGGQLRQRRG